MDGFTIEKLARVCQGRLLGQGDGSTAVGRLIIDSRQVQPGDVFAAYRGEHSDGHDFIGAALDRGAACCLAERLPEGETRSVILVESVQRAMEQIAEEYRRGFQLPVIGVTGSVGKTSAKEMIAAVLSSRFRVLKNEGNLNNQIGVPMTLSRLSAAHQAAVVEMGISGFGEMRLLARMAQPTMAVYTVIGHAHLEFLHDLQGVLQAKSEMLEEMDEGAWVIVNGDDPLLRGLQCRQRLLAVGLGEDCQVRAVDLAMDAEHHSRCTVVWGDRRIPIIVPDYGQHMIYAALQGAAAGMLMGLTDEEIVRGVAAYQGVGRRFSVSRHGGFTLIDDSYNANPDSVKSGIDSLRRFPGRHVCVLGDMLELGEDSPLLHRQVGEYAADHGVDQIYVCGRFAEDLARGAGRIARVFADRDALIEGLPGLIQKGDAVLVKASLGAGFDRVVEALGKLEV